MLLNDFLHQKVAINLTLLKFQGDFLVIENSPLIFSNFNSVTFNTHMMLTRV